jgi:DNA-binding MarR family transcriptional regulator
LDKWSAHALLRVSGKAGGVSNELADLEETARAEVDYGPLRGLVGHLLRRATGRVLGDFAETLGDQISPAEFGLLTLVANNPGITQVRLAAALSLDKSTLSPALARLTRRGLLQRERLASDGRLQALRLAPGAEARYAALREQVDAHEARIARVLTPAEREELLRLLRLLIG